MEDSRDLAFVLWALSCEAISKEELRQWAMKVISDTEDPPGYMFSLIDFDGYQKDIGKILGFVPEWEPSDDEINAMYGVAYLRNVRSHEAPDQGKCMRALRENMSIYEEYKQKFPFISVASPGL